jgi:hypothetical protein
MSALEPCFEKSLNEAASLGIKHIFQNWAHRVVAPSLQAAAEQRTGVTTTLSEDDNAASKEGYRSGPASVVVGGEPAAR